MHFRTLTVALVAACMALIFTSGASTAADTASSLAGQKSIKVVNVTGRVVAVSDTAITIATPVPCQPRMERCSVPGIRVDNKTVTLTAQTKFSVSGRPAAVGDIKLGMWAHVKANVMPVLARCMVKHPCPDLSLLIATRVAAVPWMPIR